MRSHGLALLAEGRAPRNGPHNPVNRHGKNPWRRQDHPARGRRATASYAALARSGWTRSRPRGLRDERLPARRGETERRQQPVAHHGCRPLVRGRIGADVDAAAGDHVVTARELAAEHLLEQVAGVDVALDGPDRAVEAAAE